jgi:hypothetical protein
VSNGQLDTSIYVAAGADSVVSDVQPNASIYVAAGADSDVSDMQLDTSIYFKLGISGKNFTSDLPDISRFVIVIASGIISIPSASTANFVIVSIPSWLSCKSLCIQNDQHASDISMINTSLVDWMTQQQIIPF